jgi:hypothetical protein
LDEEAIEIIKKREKRVPQSGAIRLFHFKVFGLFHLLAAWR